MTLEWVKVSDALPEENCYVKFVVEDRVILGFYDHMKDEGHYFMSWNLDVFNPNQVSMYQLIDITMPEIKSK